MARTQGCCRPMGTRRKVYEPCRRCMFVMSIQFLSAKCPNESVAYVWFSGLYHVRFSIASCVRLPRPGFGSFRCVYVCGFLSTSCCVLPLRPPPLHMRVCCTALSPVCFPLVVSHSYVFLLCFGALINPF